MRMVLVIELGLVRCGGGGARRIGCSLSADIPPGRGRRRLNLSREVQRAPTIRHLGRRWERDGSIRRCGRRERRGARSTTTVVRVSVWSSMILFGASRRRCKETGHGRTTSPSRSRSHSRTRYSARYSNPVADSDLYDPLSDVIDHGFGPAASVPVHSTQVSFRLHSRL
jgi:hypothetical protein